MEIRIRLEIPDRIRPKACFALTFVGYVTGVRFVVVSGESDVVYGATGPADRRLNYNELYYADDVKFRDARSDDEIYWLPAEAGLAANDDLGTIHRFLTYGDEPRTAGRTGTGMTAFPKGALSSARRALLTVPLADLCARRIYRQLRSGGVPAPIWPQGKRFALCLTHDVDGPEIGHAREMTKSLVKFVVRADRSEGWKFLCGMGSRVDPRHDLLWRFHEWLELERRFHARSAFYFYIASPTNRRHFHDPPYRVDRRSAKWEVIRELDEAGAEIGLQPGIYAKTETAAFARDLAVLESFGVRPVGARHHYTEINWSDPAETFSRQAASGLRYDLSIAWKDHIGFRRGTSMPFFSLPFERQSSDHLTIPTSIMDGHLFGYMQLELKSAVETARTLCEEIVALHGVVMLNWHERTFEQTPMYYDYRHCYEALLGHFCRDDAWLCLPRELADFTLERLQRYRVTA